MTDQPANKRPWSVTDDEELRHLRSIAGCVMALQIGHASPHLIRIALHEAVDSYATMLLDGTAPNFITDFEVYLRRSADRDIEEMEKPAAFTGTIEEFERLLEEKLTS